MTTSSLSSSYSLGLFFIFLVAVIWSIASIVVQYLYTDQHFDSPFFLTYIGTSLFILLLLSHTTWERRHILCSCCHHDSEKQTIIPWRTTSPYQRVPSAPIIPSSTTIETVSLEHVQIDCAAESEITCWSHQDHFKVACKIAPVWFMANWSYNCSLAYTSITSSTVLASTGSLFTFMFAVLSRDESYTTLKLAGVLLGVTGSILTGLHDAIHTNTTTTTVADGVNETIAATNSALLCVAGPSGTRHHVDISQQQDAFQNHAILGDALGLLSAVGYGAYAVMIRLFCPHDDCHESGKQTMSMQLLLGYIGLVNAVTLSPVAIYILLFQNTAASSIGLTWVVFGYLVAKGMLDNVLSDYLWARAVVLTSATVATVGLGLTIPLAFVSDLIMGHGNILDATSIVGAFAVLAGFILVNIGQEKDDDNEESEGDDGVTRDSNVKSSPPESLESEMSNEGL